MNKLYDVIISGAGPVGLFLAGELRLAGASVLVLERDANAESPWKIKPLGMRGLNTVSIEALYRRGLLHKVCDSEKRPWSFEKATGFQFGGHFAGIMLDGSKMELKRWRYRLPGPSLLPGPTTISIFEKALTEHVESLGVTILRGQAVTGVDVSEDDKVTVITGADQKFRGRWLVGCDGGRSAVRKATRFEFLGTEATFTGYAVRCSWEPTEKLKPGFHHTTTGMYIVMGSDVLYMADFDDGTFDRTKEITLEQVQDVFNRVSGIQGVNITKIHIASTFTDRCKQASTYRKGRVLLAGDAAHIHGPIGSQGLNLGLGDAINLGWKLAETIRQESASTLASYALLDTYESERHPVATSVLAWTRAQVSIIQPNPYSAAAQTLIRDLIDTVDGTNLFIDRHWGLSMRYDLGKGVHALVGCSAPDFELQDGSRLGNKLCSGAGLLVSFEDGDLQKLITQGNSNIKLNYVGTNAKDTRGIRALLIRPDGVVAWVAERDVEIDVDSAKAALQRWFGLHF